MTQELEAAALDFAGSVLHGRVHLAPDTPCANCATPLLGRWCHACGQSAEEFHRSAWRLIWETCADLLDFDARIWRTLPGLFAAPARLTRSYLDGHRAPQIPPLRLFLVMLVLVFLAGSGQFAMVGTPAEKSNAKARLTDVGPLTPDQRTRIKTMIGSADVRIMDKPEPAASGWFKAHLIHVLDDPERFKTILGQWSERFAFLSLPLATLLLSLLFVFQRRFYLFDHAIFSLHSLSAMGLAAAFGELFSSLTGGYSFLVLLGAPVHLFVHMRGVYGTGVFGTLVRMSLLFWGTAVGAGLLILGLLMVGLTVM